jgi:hypothetical protein
MLFPCPSPTGRNDAGLFLNERGELCDKYGGLWARHGTMALDALPPGLPAPKISDEERDMLDHEEKMAALCTELQHAMGESGLDLHPEARGVLIEIMNRHCQGHHSIRGRPHHGATDVEMRAALRHVAGENGHDADAPDLEEFVKFLRQRGLDEEAIREALQIVQGSGEASDKFPVSGVLGGALSGHHREAGESTYQKHGVRHHGHHGAIDAAKEAASRIGTVYGPAAAGRRLTKAERQQIAADARTEGERMRSLESRFPEIAANLSRIKTTTGRV